MKNSLVAFNGTILTISSKKFWRILGSSGLVIYRVEVYPSGQIKTVFDDLDEFYDEIKQYGITGSLINQVRIRYECNCHCQYSLGGFKSNYLVFDSEDDYQKFIIGILEVIAMNHETVNVLLTDRMLGVHVGMKQIHKPSFYAADYKLDESVLIGDEYYNYRLYNSRVHQNGPLESSKPIDSDLNISIGKHNLNLNFN